MRIRFTKMQGAGNDFVVLDETRERHHLSRAQYRFLADRHFGVGADQILTVRPAPNASLDFEYIIHNADGGEVEHCGNGARCFVRYVRDKGDGTQVTLVGNVHISQPASTSANGLRAATEMRSQEIKAFVKEERLVSEVPVEVRRGQDLFTAEKMQMNSKTGEYELSGKVRGTVHPK